MGDPRPHPPYLEIIHKKRCYFPSNNRATQLLCYIYVCDISSPEKMTAFNQSIAAEPPAVLSLVLFHQWTAQDPLKVVTISMKGVKLVIKNGQEFYLSICLLEQVLSLVLFHQSTTQDALSSVPMKVKGLNVAIECICRLVGFNKCFHYLALFHRHIIRRLKLQKNLLC